MRQRLCSNSGHHRATIAALAIKSSRGTRSVYTDRFKYVALQSRMYKRWRWGVEARRFSSRRWKIGRGQIWAKFARARSRAILDFGNSGKRGSSRLSTGFWWTDFFLSNWFLTNIKILYILGRLDQPRFYEYVHYHVLVVEWMRNRTFKISNRTRNRGTRIYFFII